MDAFTMALAIALVAGQEKPAEPSRVPKRGETIVVRGCINRGAIESTETEVRDSSGKYYSAVTYRLTGDKKVLKAIKEEHEWHVDVLTGVLKSDLANQDGRSTRIGNTRVTVVAGDPRNTNPIPQQYLPVLEVKEIEHTDVSCRRDR